jgi:F-type H+-transporting ATPase subunit delta
MASPSRHIVNEIYSDVLFQLAEEAGQVEQVLGDLAAVAGVLRDEPDFTKLLMSDKLKETEKAAVIRRVFGDRISGLTIDFLCVIARRNRVGFLVGIADRYEVLADSLKNCRLVEVTLAKSISEEQLEQLRQNINDAIRAEVKLKVNIDPEILGGVILRQGDIMIDNSVRTVLSRTVNIIMDRSKEKLHKRPGITDETNL